ncbi:PrsW family intramembrane metalloprotease [Candidatus Hydrogenisulfobacillus filiaventi]|uniref:PrsW family intramembrane metalloprotease n=1 Tax=Candidatus Hydrogenisulfobacillus filiaventi TaxID=2707344 RepID=A0A6F8ZIY9_9FIRM|nr:PrsW family glutamic-type intramembrane protease [Bacillota bacterium]CAB1129641.1 PrsW family intramembrane metalloprotease [Candidatus Hydrogenisulfobacillus filiaventi]
MLEKKGPLRTLAYGWRVARSPQYLGLFVFAVAPMIMESLRVDVIAGMMVYFSLFWLVIFRRISGDELRTPSRTLDAAAYLFTAVFGVLFAAGLESTAMAWGARRLIAGPLDTASWLTYVVAVGMVEETAKQLVVGGFALYQRWRGRVWNPWAFMALGIVSGLGFSAVENIDYVNRGVFMDMSHLAVGLGTVTALTRALYTPFLHAIWAGVAAYALGVAAQGPRWRWGPAGWGWLTVAVLHGTYDATVGVNTVWALADVAVSYFLFLYLALQRRPGLLQSGRRTSG